MEEAERWEKLLFADSVRELETQYEKIEQRDVIIKTFTDLFRQWSQQNGHAAASLGICYLHSSILMRTGELRLTLYGKEFYLDRDQIEMVWHPPWFFHMYEKDMDFLMGKLRNDYPRIYRYEEEAVRYQYAEYYYAAIEALCRDIMEEIQDSEEYKMMKKTEDFFFFFGRWRGEAAKL